MKSRMLILLSLTLAVATAAARTVRTTRPVARVEMRDNNGRPVCDTLVPQADSVLLSGYDKPLRSSKESVFVTNLTSRHVIGAVITTAYYDTAGRLFHRTVRKVDADIPQGETRQVVYPSWDRQKSFYYVGSQRPRVSATPFDVRQRVDTIFVTPLTTDPDGPSD